MRAEQFNPKVLELDCAAETLRIGRWLVENVKRLGRRGAVVAISGGVDSSVCAALATRALGRPRVLGLLLPERDSSSASTRLGRQVADQLGIDYLVEDIAPTLEAIGCYERRDAAIRKLFPEYGPAWKSKIVIASSMGGKLHYFKLVVQAPQGGVQEVRLPLKEYLEIVAATSFKQRIRKTLEYFHADRLNYAVIGTPNRLEYDQGFFVKNGDGSADVKPIAHLYKTQVYALARYLEIPEEICTARPTTDTYSMSQGQDEFYFALPYEKMDLALWAYNRDVVPAELAPHIGLSAEQTQAVYADIESKRRTTAYLHEKPLLMQKIL
jgi:NAD+ synthase